MTEAPSRFRLRALAAILAAGAVVGCGGEDPKPKAGTPPPPVALPRVGTVGDLPLATAPVATGGEGDEAAAPVQKALFVTIDPAGDIFLQVWKPGAVDRGDARKVPAAELGKAIAAETWTDVRDRTPDESSSAVHAVLRVDESVPWRAAAFALNALAEGRVYRVAFGVRPEEAGEEGVLAVYLPRDLALYPTPGEEKATRVVALALTQAKDGPPTYCAHLQGSVEEVVARERNSGGDHPLVAEVQVAPFVPIADVLHVVDAALRAGVRGVAFLGDGSRKKSADPVADAVRDARPFAARKLRVEVDGRSVPVPRPGSETPCPKVARSAGRLAGSYDATLLTRHVIESTSGGR